MDLVEIHRRVIAVVVGAAVATVIGTYFYQRSKKQRLPAEWIAVGTVKNLNIYPFKSAKKIEIEKAECTKRGVMETEKSDNKIRLRDRCFVVYHEVNREYRTGKTHPKLMLIEIKAYDANHVVIDAPDMRSLVLKIPNKSENGEVIVLHFNNEEIPGVDCGKEAAHWISQFLLEKDFGLRIAYHEGKYQRDISKYYKLEMDIYKDLRNESTGLNSDLAAMHIINQASVLDLNKKMGDSSITADNFRPNILVDGPNLKAFEEDNWKWVRVGDVVMKNVMDCPRCLLVTNDYEKGTRRPDREPLKTLEKYRRIESRIKSPMMGVYLEVVKTGIISVGDTLYINFS